MSERTIPLLSIEFTRTKCEPGATPTFIIYSMKKKTPIGVLEANATVSFRDWKAKGVEVMDGEMFFELGEQLNREEMNRTLEMGANMNFGADPAVTASG